MEKYHQAGANDDYKSHQQTANKFHSSGNIVVTRMTYKISVPHECSFTFPVFDIVDLGDRILGWFCGCGKWKDNKPLPERLGVRTTEEVAARKRELGAFWR